MIVEFISTLFFWITIYLLLYGYLLYPVAILLLSVIVHHPIRKNPDYEPKVSILITAYNEEKDIANKLRNTLRLDYPVSKLEILVASDGSTDNTDEIVTELAKQHTYIKLIRVDGRVGKTETQNQAVMHAQGEFIIFSDATTHYSRDAIKKIVQNFADRTVGAVSGRYKYIAPPGSTMGFGTIIFWTYENFIKTCQTRIRTITGCCGCIYAVRKNLYTPLPHDIISDLVQPLKILEKGYRIAFEPDALAEEKTTQCTTEELQMRTRVITRGIRGLLYMRTLLNPLRYRFVAFQLLSHKVLRWCIPILMIILFFSNYYLLGSLFYNFTFAVQSALYLLALIGFVAEGQGIKIKFLAMPLYFCVANLACLLAIINLITGQKKIAWETMRQP